MGISRFAVIVVLALVAMLQMLPASSANPIPWPPSDPPEHHDPIEINGNDDFTAENGVTEGSGTSMDPYIIENWLIEASPISSGISIRDCTSEFLIRNVRVVDSSPDDPWSNAPYGIEIDNCMAGLIVSCIISGTETGIGLTGCSQTWLHSVDISSTERSDYGISVAACVGTIIRENSVYNFAYAIWLHGSEGGLIEDNDILAANDGITLIDCSGITVGENTLLDTSFEYYDNAYYENNWFASERVISSTLGQVLLLGIVVPANAALVILGVMRYRRAKSAP